MSINQGSINVQRKAAAIPPAGVTNANNGLSVSAGIAQLGQTYFQAGDPAIFLNNREIPMGGFGFRMMQGFSRQFVVDPDLTFGFPYYGLGDIDQVDEKAYLEMAFGLVKLMSGGLGSVLIGDGDSYGNESVISINDQFRTIIASIGGSNFLELDRNVDIYQLGDINNDTSGLMLIIDNDPTARDIRLGDRNFNNNGTYLNINDVLRKFIMTTDGREYFVIDSANDSSVLRAGDTTYTAGESEINLALNTGDGGIQLYAQDSTALKTVDLQLRSGLENVEIEISGNQYFLIDAANNFIVLGDGNGLIDGLGFGVNYIAIGEVEAGDIAGIGNSTRLIINDTAQTAAINSGGDKYLYLDVPNKLFQIADGASGEGYIEIDNFSGLIRLIGADGSGTVAELQIDGLSEQAILFALNGLKITGDNILIHTGTALANGAGASAGTLLNAPAAGNPTKWIPIDDNGTTRHIPAW